MADIIRKHGVTQGAKYYACRIIPSAKKVGWIYPWFYHWFLSLFSKTILDRYMERFINPIIDSAFCCFVFLSLYRLYSLQIAVKATLLYIFTPAFFSIQSPGPRTGGATPRLVGEIFVNIIFFAIYIYSVKGSYLSMIVATALASLIPVTSKFSLQALFLIFFAAFFLEKEVALIVVPLLGLGLSVILFRRSCISVLRGQYRHLKWYMRMNLKGKTHVSPRNSFSFLLKLIREKGLIYGLRSYALYYNSFLISFIKFPIAWFSLYAIFRSGVKSWNLGAIFILSSFLIFLITSLKPFLFLGEAERYLNHVAIFILLHTAEIISDKILWILVSYGILWNIADIMYAISKREDKNSKLDSFVVSYLKKCTFPLRVLTVPFSLGGWQILYRTNHKWFYPLIAISSGYSEYAGAIMGKYPYIEMEKLPHILLKHRIDIAIINLSSVRERKILWKEIPRISCYNIKFLKPSLLVVQRKAMVITSICGGEKMR